MEVAPCSAPPIPILRVANLRSSVDYYVNLLGFEIDWDTPTITSVSRGHCCVFLSEGDQGNPGSWMWIGVEDASALHDELLAKGAKIRQPPTNFPWALEIQAEDLDGNVRASAPTPSTGNRSGRGRTCTGGCGLRRKRGGGSAGTPPRQPAGTPALHIAFALDTGNPMNGHSLLRGNT